MRGREGENKKTTQPNLKKAHPSLYKSSTKPISWPNCAQKKGKRGEEKVGACKKGERNLDAEIKEMRKKRKGKRKRKKQATKIPP
jgi:hypothetical protein